MKNRYRLVFTLFPFFPNSLGETISFLHNEIAKSILIESLILYDQIVIPTQNLLELIILGEWLGYDFLVDLIKNENILFLQQGGRIAFSGKGKELATISFVGSTIPINAERYFVEATMHNPAEAAEIILKNGTVLSSSQISAICKAVGCSSSKLLPDELEIVVKQTYQDLTSNTELSNALGIVAHGRKIIGGPGQDQLQFGWTDAGELDDASKLMRLAFLNCILAWGSHSSRLLKNSGFLVIL